MAHKNSTTTTIIGKRFKRLVVINDLGCFSPGRHYLLVRCDCGIEKMVRKDCLMPNGGGTTSCGCRQKELTSKNHTVHGHCTGYKSSPTYKSWRKMIGRCTNPNDQAFPYYGGRGIKVCKRWRSFENFYEDMGPRLQGMTLDRYPDVNGAYKPTNCRWATRKQQANNRRDVHTLRYKGRTYTLAEWSEKTGIGRETLRSRLYRRTTAWTPSESMIPPRQHR